MTAYPNFIVRENNYTIKFSASITPLSRKKRERREERRENNGKRILVGNKLLATDTTSNQSTQLGIFVFVYSPILPNNHHRSIHRGNTNTIQRKIVVLNRKRKCSLFGRRGVKFNVSVIIIILDSNEM
jgi:hypothetical protein